MMLDKLTEFADSVLLTVTASTTSNIGSQIDLGAGALPVGGAGLPWLVIVAETPIVPTSTTATTVQFQLVGDDNAAISATTQSVYLKSAIFVVDDDPVIPAGTVLWCVPLPVLNNGVSRALGAGTAAAPLGAYATTGQGAPYERFLGVQSIVGAGAALGAACTVSAFLTLTPPAWKAMADASN